MYVGPTPAMVSTTGKPGQDYLAKRILVGANHPAGCLAPACHRALDLAHTGVVRSRTSQRMDAYIPTLELLTFRAPFLVGHYSWTPKLDGLWGSRPLCFHYLNSQRFAWRVTDVF